MINGPAAKTVLIRAIGPALPLFGIAEYLPAPALTVFQTGGLNASPLILAYNAGWSGDLVLSQTMSQVGAFGLANNSQDSAVVLTLPPGSYTANVTSSAGLPGIGLVEIYEVP